MLDLWPYLAKFDSEENLKDKMDPNDYYMKDINCRLVIVIIYNNYIFFANNKKTHR